MLYGWFPSDLVRDSKRNQSIWNRFAPPSTQWISESIFVSKLQSKLFGEKFTEKCRINLVLETTKIRQKEPKTHSLAASIKSQTSFHLWISFSKSSTTAACFLNQRRTPLQRNAKDCSAWAYHTLDFMILMSTTKTFLLFFVLPLSIAPSASPVLELDQRTDRAQIERR